jgi:hypothetical protein
MATRRRHPVLPLFAVSLACATGPKSGTITADTGCYALVVADWYGSLATATGLGALPPYVALDSAPAGIRGHRLRVPPIYQTAGPNPDWATWRFDRAGLVLTFLGSAGTVEVLLHQTPTGYAGETVTPFPRALPPVSVRLAPSACAGLGPRPS